MSKENDPVDPDLSPEDGADAWAEESAEDWAEESADDWAEDELVRALRAPADASELVDEQRFVAAFTQAQGRRGSVAEFPRRVVRRLGAGGSAVIVVAALSGGVAAAFTGNLPDPVQEFAHTVLGAPAPEPDSAAEGKRRAERPPSPRRSPSTPSVSPTGASATPSASPSPSTTPSRARDPESSPSPNSTGAPTGGPSAEPSEEPTATPTTPAVVPAALSMSGATHLVEYGATMTLVGQLTTASGDPVTGHRVSLQVRGDAGWRPVAVLASNAAGQASASTEAITGRALYRWRAGRGLHSDAWRLRVKPSLAAAYVIDGDTTTINVTSVGAKPGDQVQLYALVRKVPTLVGTASVGDAGGASFAVRTPARRRVFSIRLEATPDHAPARTRLTVAPG